MKIGILEDDPDQLALLARWLGNDGHQVQEYLRGEQMRESAGGENFDLFVLDWEVPDLSGVQVLQWIRTSLSRTVPVLFITARDTEEDIVTALEAGADDYIIKPARRSETLARIAALLRRAYPKKDEASLSFPPYEFDTRNGTARISGEQVELMRKEFEVIVELFRNVESLMSCDELQRLVWHDTVVTRQTVVNHVDGARRKLGLRGEHGFKVAGVFDHGYRAKRIPDNVAQLFSGR